MVELEDEESGGGVGAWAAAAVMPAAACIWAISSSPTRPPPRWEISKMGEGGSSFGELGGC